VTILQAAILGVVQGLTEFLPISSDGHLAVTYRLMGTSPNLAFEVFLHAATLGAMLVYFWSDVVRLLSSLLPKNRERTGERRLVLLIAIATVISAVVALALGDVVQPLSESMVAVALGFLGTTLLLVIAEIADRKGPVLEGPQRLSFTKLGVVGLLQGLAVLPGLSRSGSTISGGMLFGLSREDAARFAFLLGIPIIALASAKDTLDVVQGAAHLPGAPTALVVGFLAAGLSGYAAIWGLLKFVKTHSLYWFAAYTGVLGTVMLLSATVFGRG
jgi:undecaprenyl-diphosphatase